MKIKAILLAIMLGLCFIACGKEEAVNYAEPTSTPNVTGETQEQEKEDQAEATQQPEQEDVTDVKGDEGIPTEPENTNGEATDGKNAEEQPAKDKKTNPETSVEQGEDAAEDVAEVTQVPEETESLKLYETSLQYNPVKMDEYDDKDKVNAVAYQTGNTAPYYLGRDDANTEYLLNNKTAEDGVLYLGLPLYLPGETLSKEVFFSISDETVAAIEGDELIGLKQGSFVLSSYDKEKNHIADKTYYVTTFNDSKDDIAQAMTLQKVPMGAFTDAEDIDYWKTAICTIQDMSYFLQARFFRYDFAREPELACIERQGNEKQWVWEADANTIFNMNGGVCIQVAQLATYMLAGDYEDWGVVMISGNQGHIFNWFYEDGYYYLFDFTDVISYNAFNKDYNSPNFYQYVDFSDKVIKRETIEEIREYCTTRKVDLSQNYLIYMYSCKGHDYLPCSLNTGMSDSNGVLNGYYDQVIMGYQDVVMEDLVILYEKEECNVEFRSYKRGELPIGIPRGIYNNPREIKYYFNY